MDRLLYYVHDVHMPKVVLSVFFLSRLETTGVPQLIRSETNPACGAWLPLVQGNFAPDGNEHGFSC